MRTIADLCGSGGDDTGAWIGVEPRTGGQITQIGLLKLVTSSTATESCRFWATGAGTPHVYGCGADAGGTWVWFQIRLVGTVDGEYYSVEDCGKAGGYGSCVARYVGQPYYGAGSWALASSESTHACHDTLLGSPTKQVHYGSSTWPIKEMNAISGSWASHPVDNFEVDEGSSCGTDYQHTFTYTTLQTWDQRN